VSAGARGVGPFTAKDIDDIRAVFSKNAVSAKTVADIVENVLGQLVDEHGWFEPGAGATEIVLVDQVATSVRDIDANVRLGLNASGTVVAIFLIDPPIEMIDCS
jgi:hypothetical protein